MPTGHTTTAQQEKVVNPKSSPKRAREQRSDDGPTILPGMEHFVDLLRKVKRPALVVRLLEHASGDALPELQALAVPRPLPTHPGPGGWPNASAALSTKPRRECPPAGPATHRR